ncbi:MAG: DNA replication/repair protein RecF [Actinobacteria bacterium]|nr:MAG: DNA replication/repair protein RecF [Actinomycetota bacterium]
MRVERLWLTDFRNYESADVSPAPGLTVVVGDNGEGKTNLLEAVGYLATLGSFRGAPRDALVREGSARAIVRAEIDRAPENRRSTIEAELALAGRDRVLVNRQTLRRARDLLGALRVVVFSPDDLALVKGGPAERRRYLDDTMVAVDSRLDAVREEFERVLRQRNALLRQAAGGGGRLSGDLATTLEVWDERLAGVGERLGAARADLCRRLEPLVAKCYAQVAGNGAHVGLTYEAPWREPGLAAALVEARVDELRRGISLVGPHRDDVGLSVDGLPSRTHASQGEQRSLALALRLGAHTLVTDVIGVAPVLLLDDIFSELDADRSAALVAHLPDAQALLATTAGVPAGARADLVLRVAGGRIA